MTLRSHKIKKHTVIFKRLFGMDLKNFALVVQKLSNSWIRRVIKRYKRPGRNYKLQPTEMLMMLVLPHLCEPDAGGIYVWTG
jgi:hypothetical protein